MNSLAIITIVISAFAFTAPTPPDEGLGGGRRSPSEDTRVDRPGGLLGTADGSGNPDTKAPKFIRTPINEDQVKEYSELLHQVLIDAKTLKEVEPLVSQWDNATTMDKKGVLDLIQAQQELASKELKVKTIRLVLDENYQANVKGSRIKDNYDDLKKKYDTLFERYDDLKHHRSDTHPRYTPPGRNVGVPTSPGGVNRPGGLLGGAGADGGFSADGSGNPDTKAPTVLAPKFIRTPISKDEVNEYSELLRQALIDAKALKEVEALVSQWDSATTMDKSGILDLIKSQRELASKELKVKTIRFVLDGNYQESVKGSRIKDNYDDLKKKYDTLLERYNDLKHHR